MMEVVSFPTATSVEVIRGVEGTTGAAHNSGVTVRALQIKVPSETTTARDLTASDTVILVESSTGTLSSDYIKIDNEFMQVSNSATITTGTVLVVLAEEKPTPIMIVSNRIRYLYSQVRLTGHDFLDIGTGNKTQTNWLVCHFRHLHLVTKLTKYSLVVCSLYPRTKMVTSPLVVTSKLTRQLVAQP